MAIEGPLRELPLPDVFQLLDLSRKTGTLSVYSEQHGRPAVIHFDAGAVVGAEIPEEASRLGHLLLRSGKISERAMQLAREEQGRQPHRPFGTVLVEMGLARPEDVRQQIRVQIEQTVFELVRWTDGYFRFEEGEPNPPGTLAVRVSTEALLMEAARRIDEWTTLEAKLPHTGLVPVLLGGEAQAEGTLDLGPAEWEVLAEVDGERSVKQIAAELGRSDFEVAKVVYGLLATGVVEVQPPHALAPAPTHGRALDDGLAEVERLCGERRLGEALGVLDELSRQHPPRAELAFWRGRVLAAQGHWAEAAGSLADAVRRDPLLAAAHFHLGFAATRAGDLSRAAAAWGTYLRLPETPPRERALAQTALEAATTLQQALRQTGL